VFSWIYRLCADEFGVTGHGSSGQPGGWTLNLASGKSVQVAPHGKRHMTFRTDDERVAKRLDDIGVSAVERALRGDTGSTIWWRTGFKSTPFGVGNLLGLQGIRVLSEQRLLAPEEGIDGTAYVSTSVTYAGDPSDAPMLSGGEMETEVTFRTPGPSHTAFADQIAHQAAGMVRAYLSLATGLMFQGVPMSVFPARPEHVETAQRRLREGVPELWFLCDDRQRQVPIWPALAHLGADKDLHERIRGFLGCYEVAISQTSSDAAIAFLVAAIEALGTPPTSWRREKTVQRFMSFVSDLAPDTLDRILGHANFADAFGPKKSHRSFLDHLHDLRSRPFHGGLVPVSTNHVENPGGVRIALASELARDVLARFLDPPRTPLVGHPMTANNGT
jgi:hypothetical protein